MRPGKGHRSYSSIALPSTQSLDLGALSGTIWQKKPVERGVLTPAALSFEIGTAGD